jgi:hypothetical protein
LGCSIHVRSIGSARTPEPLVEHSGLDAQTSELNAALYQGSIEAASRFLIHTTPAKRGVLAQSSPG